jgi:guanosine-3',5'-bis(diphosphate) 3'-pyrophosphohydrolase
MLYDLMKKIDKAGNINKELVIKAYNLAAEAHGDQRRISGEPYVTHPVEVASILVDMGMDTNTVVAGLLHDVIEDTKYTFDEIAELFSVEIAELVDGVTKLGKIKYKSKEEEQADNVRKMLLAMAKDIRVILIKLADRLHNMRTLRYMQPEKQREKSKETFDIYAPLAHRLGMFRIKWELEDLAFRYMYPTEYYDLVNQIAEKRKEREAYIKMIMDDIVGKLKSASIECDIDGRPKHFYSIYKKMMAQNKNIDQIFDLTAIRVLVDSIKDCYAALGIVHTIYKPIPGRFKDYIAMPKPNMYQSLHTTVIGPQGKPFEIQIRTYEMHRVAEYGIAAHWKYKETGSSKEAPKDSMDQKLIWVRDMLEWQKETSDAEEFMEAFKIDLFGDEIFVFTPKGEVINLPYRATPIDFAYRIHTDVGNRTIGAKVNGNMVTLDYKLTTGEIVEIITSSKPKGPNIDWLNIATSNQAKTKIKAWFKKEKREENIQRGKELLEKEAKKQDRNFADIAKGEILDKLIRRYHGNNIDDLFVVVGASQVLPSTIVTALKEAQEEEKRAKINEDNKLSLIEAEKMIEAQKKKEKAKKKSYFGVVVAGMSNVQVRFAKCCNPVPGDQIIGFITNFRGISIHRSDCANIDAIKNDKTHRIVEVSWEKESQELYSARVQINAMDRPNLVSDIIALVHDLKIPLNAMNVETRKDASVMIHLSLLIKDINLLEECLKRLRKLSSVMDAFRIGNV